MASLKFSSRAKADLRSIGRYTIRTWGKDQAKFYLVALNARCMQLAENPFLGRASDDVRKGLRRMEQGKHVVFYRAKKDGIVIVCILHERMLPR